MRNEGGGPLYGAGKSHAPNVQWAINSHFMPDRFRCRVENAVVRPDRRETLDDLVYKMFERRHHQFVGGPEQDWLTVELVQSLRRKSRVYREQLSSETEGPLPLALGYFKRREESLELVSDQIPAAMAPRPFVLFLSEFLEPGARFWFSQGEHEEAWRIEGEGEVSALSSPSA